MASQIILPDVDFLHECFSYENGSLVWKIRPERHFKTKKAWKIFNTSRSLKKITYKDNDGYIKVNIGQRPVRVHRIIYTMLKGEIPKGFDIDHINGVRDDNRIENLRVASRKENLHNSKVHKDSKFGIKGISITKTGRFDCRVMVGGKIYREFFLTEKESIEWLQMKRKEIHG